MFSTSDPRVNTSATPSRLSSRDIPVWAPERMATSASSWIARLDNLLGCLVKSTPTWMRAAAVGVVASDLFS